MLIANYLNWIKIILKMKQNKLKINNRTIIFSNFIKNQLKIRLMIKKEIKKD